MGTDLDRALGDPHWGFLAHAASQASSEADPGPRATTVVISQQGYHPVLYNHL